MTASFLSFCLLAWVSGNLLLNQQSALPGPARWWACVLGGLAAVGVALLVLRRRHDLQWQRILARSRVAVVVWHTAPMLVWLAPPGAMALGFALSAWQMARVLDQSLPSGLQDHDLDLTGVVQTLPTLSADGVRFVFWVDTVNGVARGARFPQRVSLGWYRPRRADAAQPMPLGVAEPRWPLMPSVLPAQRWSFRVHLRQPHGALNPGGFDAEAWLLEQGIRAQGSVRAGPHDPPPRLMQAWVWAFNPLVDRARARLRSVLQDHVRPWAYGAVLVALVMGDQAPVGEADWALFNRTGVSHLISISGLHITMIAAVVAMLSGVVWRRVPAWHRVPVLLVQGLAGLLGAWAYCLVAGWGVPAQRTLIMLAVVAFARCRRQRLPPGLTLALAAWVVCLWDPLASLSAGFWLSFGAVAFIFAAMAGYRPEPVGWRALVWQAVRVQGAITLGQVPLTMAIFGQVSVVAPLANALAIPLVSYIVAPLALSGAALVVLPAPAPLGGHALLWTGHAVFQFLCRYLQALCALPGAWFSQPDPPLWAVLLASMGCWWAVQGPGWPCRWCGLAWLAALFAWPPLRPAPGQLWVTALDVGQGMALVLESHDTLMVFDTGPRLPGDIDAATRVIAPYLRSRGYAQLPLLVISHPDTDHAGGAASLMRALPVGRVWTSVAAGHPLLDGRVPDWRCEQGQTLSWADMRIQVLSPAPAVYANPRASSNAHSCVLRVQVADHAVLLTGDVPARQEASLLAWANQPGWSVRSDLMVAPHHGSHTSSSEALIAAVGPRWVSMQLGYRNHFGHPHDEVLRRYAAHQVRVLRSDQAGAVQWRFASALPLPGGPDDDVTIEVWRESHRRYWHWGAPDFLSLDQPAAVAGGPTMEAVSPAGEDP